MGQSIAGPEGPASEIRLDQLAAHIRDNCDSIASSLEEAVTDIETAVLPENRWRGQRVLQKLHRALDGVHRLARSERTDHAAVAGLAAVLEEIFKDLEALRRGIREDA